MPTRGGPAPARAHPRAMTGPRIIGLRMPPAVPRGVGTPDMPDSAAVPDRSRAAEPAPSAMS